MQALQHNGYDVQDLPSSGEQLMLEVIHDAQAQYTSPELNIAYRMSVPEYEQLTPYSQRLEENWDHRPVISTVMGKIC